MDKYIISVEGSLTSYVFYSQVLSQLHDYYVTKDSREILFDFRQVKAIDSLVIPNLLCICYIIKTNSNFTPSMIFSNNIAANNIRRYVNDIKLVSLGETFDLIKFSEDVKGGWSEHKINDINTTTFFNVDEDENTTWNKLYSIINRFTETYADEFNISIDYETQRNLLFEISKEIIENSKNHGRSFIFITLHYNHRFKKIRLSYSDCGQGFLNTMKNKVNVKNNFEAIVQGIYTRKNEKAYGLYSVIKKALSFNESVVRIHSMDTQLILTSKLLLELEIAKNCEQLIEIMSGKEYSKNIRNNLKYGGVHIEFDIDLNIKYAEPKNKLKFLTLDRIALFPLSFNHYLYGKNLDENSIKFKLEENLSLDFLSDLLVSISDLIEKQKYEYIIFDMQNVSAYFSRKFQEFKIFSDNIIFINLKCKTSDLLKKIITDFEQTINVHIDNEKYSVSASSYDEIFKKVLTSTCNLAYFSVHKNEEITTKYGGIDKLVEKIYTQEYLKITRKCIDDEMKFLGYLSIYGNMHINLRKVFLIYEDYAFLIYTMANIASKQINLFDAFVSSSKTGAIFATLLSQMLDKKTVNCEFLGPVHNHIGYNQQDVIRKNKKYFYVADFICLGTELKILDTFIQTKDSKIVAGIAVASYINLHNENEKSILNQVECLLNVRDADILYQINIDKNALKKDGE